MKIFILAGEPSGDEYGAELMKHLQSKHANLRFDGIGGPLMEKCGLKSMASFDKMSVMGFVEIIKALPFFIRLEKQIIDFILINKPDKIILIDYPGLNLRLCEKIKKTINCTIFYYISPQIWAWKEKRINIIKKYVNYMIAIFAFEKQWYMERGIKVQYWGHPFLDIWEKNDTKNFMNKYNLDKNKPIITLFPGSRSQELNKHLNLFIRSALAIKQSVADAQILIGIHPNIDKPKINNKNIIIVHDTPLKALEVATFAIIASGTATLQSAIMKTPAIVIYKMNPWSWYLTKNMVQVKFASMANIIADDLVFPELLQQKATVENICELGMQIISDTTYRSNMMDKIQRINEKIGAAGASEKIAQFILENN